MQPVEKAIGDLISIWGERNRLMAENVLLKEKIQQQSERIDQLLRMEVRHYECDNCGRNMKVEEWDFARVENDKANEGWLCAWCCSSTMNRVLEQRRDAYLAAQN